MCLMLSKIKMGEKYKNLAFYKSLPFKKQNKPQIKVNYLAEYKEYWISPTNLIVSVSH